MANQKIYRQYVIKTMVGGKGWNARAFRGKLVVGQIQSAITEEEAVSAVQRDLDSIRTARRAHRGADGYPTSQEVREALAAIDMTDQQRAMLSAHADAPDNIMTATELAAAGGYESYVSANSQYGGLGRKLAEEVEWEPPLNKRAQTWTSALATGVDDEIGSEATNTSHWRWKLRPQVKEALQGEGLSQA